MIIDAHNHPDYHGFNIDETLQNMAEFHIDKMWLLTLESPSDEYDHDPGYNHLSLPNHWGPIPFARCLRYKEQFPDKFVLGYGPDPRRPDTIEQLQSAIEKYGVQVYGELKLRMMYDNWDALRLFHFCGRHGLPVTVHISYEYETGRQLPRSNWWYGGGIEAFERAVAACPETTFIGHAPGFWAHISNDERFARELFPSGRVIPNGKVVRMLRQYPNLYADLSAGSGRKALERDREFARKFLIEFQDRLLYGRDTFDNRLQELLNSLALPNEVLAKIYADNALKLVSK